MIWAEGGKQGGCPPCEELGWSSRIGKAPVLSVDSEVVCLFLACAVVRFRFSSTSKTEKYLGSI